MFTTEFCECGNVCGSCNTCPKSVSYLDCLVSVYEELQDDGSSIYQLKTCTYSKSMDVHHYIDPSSCTPQLTRKSPAIIKGVAHRLRLTNMLDEDLLSALNHFSGYLEASGYDKKTIIKHFSAISLVSNRSLAFQTKAVDSSFKIALVTRMHPALPDINKIFDQFYFIISGCPVSTIILPRDSLISSHRKLPSLSSTLAGNPFNVPSPPTLPKGFYKSPGCSCKICKESTFKTIIHSPSLPGRGFTIPRPTCCKSANVVYSCSCPCGLLYVGRTKEPRSRWANHKSHIRTGHKTCKLASHCINMHPDLVGPGKMFNTDFIKASIDFTILESVGVNGSDDELAELEEIWRNRLQTWAPSGLNVREDGPSRMRHKRNRS